MLTGSIKCLINRDVDVPCLLRFPTLSSTTLGLALFALSGCHDQLACRKGFEEIMRVKLDEHESNTEKIVVLIPRS